jgi:2-amino-4-hydroxy-6-hydroxymethyldihydropteridine diphosphokinase
MTPLFIALGSNLGNKGQNLQNAKDLLRKSFHLNAQSSIYSSPPVDYLDQPHFFNQVLEFRDPNISPKQLIQKTQRIELVLGRTRLIPKGPRIIDIDVLLWGQLKFHSKNLELPHPRMFKRSFVILPLRTLPGFTQIKNHFPRPNHFENKAFALN